ncbi:Satratoxin biosynthesis SC1 cluster protein 4 [Madurella fahalii]|uniref:Satratoxin biosynthesis SC1 cluster protein 4 n=1 Tax=Madurella fahalii TaxID=1157608 RepID=A0ABQ0GJD6_9PEZI
MSSGDSTIVAAAPPPPGVTPNFEDPESISYQLTIVGVVFPVLALCFLIPRLYSAAFIIRKWHPDDYLIVIGFTIGLVNSLICIVQSTMGMGIHIWDLPLDAFKAVMKLGMIGGAMTYNLCTLFIKLSILSFYLRFSIDRAFRMAVYFVMFVTVGYTIPNAFLFLYICQPMAYYWDWAINGWCINQQATFDAANILNMTTDYAILLLPIWMLRPLRRPLLKKIGITLILMTGGFVCGISTMRMVTAKNGADNSDITWHYPTNLIWCLVEEFVGVICACLPCLKAFVKHFFPNLFLFNPTFEQRLTSSFMFSRTASGGGNNNNNNNSSNAGDGKRAWWRRKAAVAVVEDGTVDAVDAVGAVENIGSKEEGMGSKESDVGHIEVREERDSASAETTPGEKKLAEVTDVERDA